MAYYTIANGIIVGMCLGLGILFLFTSLRRKDGRQLYLLFALFAIGYGATLFNGIRFHNATSLDFYLTINRQDTFFVILAFTALIWYVAEYTRVKSRGFLSLLTIVFFAVGLAQVTRPNLIYDQILGLSAVVLPWGEEVAYLEATDSFWSLLFLVAQLSVLGYLVYACLRQYLRGEKRDALILSIGTIWFVAALTAELLGGKGLLPPIFYGEFGFLGFAVAISIKMANDVIKTEEELDEIRLNLEQLVGERTAELEVAQEKLVQQTQEEATLEERSRLARDLHDAVTQTIYSAALIAEVLPAVWERDPDQGRRNLAKLRQLVRGALAEMRALLFELRPSTLESADLGSLLRQQADALTGRTRIPVTVDVDGERELPPEVTVALYRITQEAFNNVEKHARADQVKIILNQSSGEVRLTIQDNGLGFTPASISADHMGIQFMKERAENINATFDLESEPGRGTRVCVTWSEPGI